MELPTLSVDNLNPNTGVYAVFGLRRTGKTTVIQKLLSLAYSTHHCETFKGKDKTIGDRIAFNLNRQNFMLVIDKVEEVPLYSNSIPYKLELENLILDCKNTDSVVILSGAPYHGFPLKGFTGIFLLATAKGSIVLDVYTRFLEKTGMTMMELHSALSVSKHGLYIDLTTRKVYRVPKIE